MPRTKKIQKRSWDYDDEENQVYDLVVKKPVLYKLPQNYFERVLLYGDVVIDVDTLISNQNSYVPKLEHGLVRINKMVKMMKEQQLVFYLETAQKQLTDFSSIIKTIDSLSSQAAHDLALRITQHQEYTSKVLKSCSQNNENQKCLVSLQYDPEQLLERCFAVVKQHLDYEGQIFNFNLYNIDPEKMRMNKYLNSNHLSLLQILCDDEEELKRRSLSYRINQTIGDLDQYIRIQIPLLDQEIEQEVTIYTLDNYIIQAKVVQKCIRLHTNNVLMLRKYIIDPTILQELKRVRQMRRNYVYQLNSNLLSDQSSSPTHSSTHSRTHSSTNDSSQEFQESLSYNIQTFIPKYEPIFD